MYPKLSALLSRHLIDRSGGYRAEVMERFFLIREMDRLSRTAIETRQAERLFLLLQHAAGNVPFYQELLSGRGLEPGSVRSLLADLPIIQRQELKSNVERYRSKQPGDVYENSTGGSSGEPLVFWMNIDSRQAAEAGTYWGNSLAGWQCGDRVAMLWGADRDVEEESDWLFVIGYLLLGKISRAKSVFRKQVENVRWYNSFDMGPDRMRIFHKKMSRFKPHILVGYAGSLFEYARFLEAENLQPDYPLKSIISSAEVLTSAYRKQIERVFGPSVFDRYGNREFGPIAVECGQHAGLHINENDLLVEIDSPDPANIPGDIIVTCLNNFAQPFIRYNTGDRSTLVCEPCTCGRTTLRLGKIEGRSSDSITTSDGKMIHGEYFTHLLYGCEEVKAFQFVQESLSSYVLKVECEPQVAQMYADDWQREIRKQVGGDADVRIDAVGQIPVLPSGKRKFTLSLIAE